MRQTFSVPRRIKTASRRAGTLFPALAVALIAVLGSAALVLDRLWLDAAHSELRTAAEAAALAGAKELASDDWLRKSDNVHSRLNKARFAAARIAAQNFVVGEPLMLRLEQQDDIRFGVLSKTDNETVFAETEDNPTTVVIAARRTRARDSEVPLPVQSLLGPSGADVIEVAEATVDNRVVGLRPIAGLPLPTLPIALPWQADDSASVTHKVQTKSSQQIPQSKQTPQSKSSGWQRDIEQRQGSDHWGFDSSSGEIIHEPDGIPEITVRTASLRPSKASATNAFVVTLSSDWSGDSLRRQIERGWTTDDLESVGGELIFGSHTHSWAGLRGVDASMLSLTLQNVIGQARVCWLYEKISETTRSVSVPLKIRGFVVARVLTVRELSQDECEVVLQPAVLATRFAVLASECDGKDANALTSPRPNAHNPYLYKLQLTN